MGDDELKILIEAALDLEKSFQNMVVDMNKLRERMKTYQIKVLAGLDKSASSAQIKSDLVSINKGKNKVKLVGQVDRSETKKNVESALKNLKGAEIKIAGVLDSAALKQQLGSVPDMSAKVSADVKGAEQVENLKKQMEQAGNSASGLAAKIYLARTALQILRRTVREAIDTVQELDKAATELAIVTGTSSDNTYGLLEQYSQMAKELGATTTQISDAAASWLRQGKSAAETASLIEQSMILSKVAMMNSEDATKRLTSALNGYKLAAQDASAVVDKLAALDSRAAVTAEDLAIAMSQTASSANIGGVSMDRLLGYLTTVQEVTQRSAETIGQSFKTIFARIGNIKLGNFLSDDGEDLSDVETVLKSYGIALRNAGGDFRNFGDVLDDVYGKWEQFGAIDKRAVAQAFAGTRQQENFLVLMENYGKALEYAGVAADSAGTALQKFAAYEDSVEAKANAFTAAVENLTMDTIDSGFVKDLIDVGTAIVELTEKAGLLKATLLAMGAGATMKGVQIMATGFRNISQNILNLGESINVLRRVDDASSLTGETINRLGTLTKGLSNDQLKLVLTSKQLSTTQMQAILMASGLTKEEAAQKLQTLGLAASQKTAAGATWSLSSAMQGLGASIKAAFVANPIGATMMAISAVTVVVSLLTNAWQKTKQAAEEARNAMNEAANAANDRRDSLADLIKEYRELAKAGDFDSSARDTAKRIQQDITDLVGQQADNLDLVNGKLDDEIDKLDAIRIQNAYEARDTLDTKFRDAKSQFEAGIEATGSGTNAFGVIVDESSINQILQKIGYINEAWENVNGQISFGYAASKGNAEEVLAMYKELQHLLLNSNEWQSLADDPWSGWIGISSQDILNNVQKQIEFYEGLVDEYNSAQQNFLENEAVIDLGETLKTTNIDSQGAFDSYIQGIKDSTEYSEAYKDILIDLAQDTFPEFNNAAQQATDDGSSVYVAHLEKLADVISGLRTEYDALKAAQEDMAGGGGLSADTIESLASAEENYLDYLYEENGVIKLNTEAWKENANAKMQNEIAEIQKEIDSLEERNRTLAGTLELYRTNQHMAAGNSVVTEAWAEKIQEVTDEINSNSDAIAANQNKLAIYETLYGSLTGGLDAYSSALSNFANVQNTIEGVSNSFQTLAELQAEVANGFSLSLDKALEFASVYPEILNNAQVSADGQVILNQGVVNSFIRGKKAELDAQVDAEIVKLEADKAVLQAKMEAAQAQLDLAKAVAEGEGGISKELAEYRINAGNAVTQALIDAGVDEATAFKLAAAAMAQNAEEFDRVAMEVCTDVNGNFNQAAYDLAQTMYNNLTNVKTDLASVAKQAHETAKAIAGIEDGSVSGSSAVQGGSGGGTNSSGISLNLTSGSFEGTEYTYTAKESGLEGFISQIELDITDYQNAISQIDGQIATLRALKNIPLKEFEGGLGNNSSSGSKNKDVEEYIADIDAYREAIERLRKAQQYASDTKQTLDNTEDLKQRILLERQLIGAYAKEQEALHNLNNQRDSTITAGAKALRELGFEVQYNADTNEFWIANMEHLNELQADSVGTYGSLQEATNALRQDTEDLINSLTDLNDENREGSQTWWDLKYSMQDANAEILQLLDDIVAQASEAVDTIQDVYDTLHDAADEYAASGYVTIDTLQSIIDLGLKYTTYLMDENGQLVINEERIRDVVAAKTQQLAIESSLSYVEALRIARQAGDLATLNDLLYATQGTTDATWGLVYANLALAGLDEDQYQAALNNINAIRTMADSAIQSIGQTSNSVTDELNNMKDGLDDILKYVMDMLKQRINDQIDALEDMKDAYSEIIDKKKESLEASKDEADYQKTMTKKLREIAKLQAKIDALSLDDSREAQAEKAKLLEEMAELQEDVADEQADKSLEATENVLDDMETAYHEEKDREIAILEDSISSYQKLYDMAIEYIQNNWDTLYSELISWNTQYGDVLNSEITTAWDNCLAAAQRYGSYVSALNNIGADIDAAGQEGNTPNTVIGKTTYDNASTNDEMVHAIIKKMYANSQAYFTANNEQRKAMHQENVDLGARLSQYGIKTVFDNGYWYVDKVGGELLYNKFKKYTYHSGGIAGDAGTLKDNEILAKLEKGEPVLTTQMWDNLTAVFDRISHYSAAIGDLPLPVRQAVLDDTLKRVGGGTVTNVTNSSQPVEITIGDTIIQGNASLETVKQHTKVSYDMVDQISRILKIRL